MTITLENFAELSKLAREMFHSQPEKAAGPSDRISIDAIFAAVVSCNHKQGRSAKAAVEAAPEWFLKAVAKLKGKQVEIGDVLRAANRKFASRPDVIAAGRWLREAGHNPIKRGGKLLFQL